MTDTDSQPFHVKKQNLIEDLFLKACAKVVVNNYEDKQYHGAVCDECRFISGDNQMQHECYWKTEDGLTRERMAAVLLSLHRKAGEVFNEMSFTIRAEDPLFESVTAEDVLDFFGDCYYYMPPLEAVNVNDEWKQKILRLAMAKVFGFDMDAVPSPQQQPNDDGDGDATPRADASKPPLFYSQSSSLQTPPSSPALKPLPSFL
jgi:hypothetical protein